MVITRAYLNLLTSLSIEYLLSCLSMLCPCLDLFGCLRMSVQLLHLNDHQIFHLVLVRISLLFLYICLCLHLVAGHQTVS